MARALVWLFVTLYIVTFGTVTVLRHEAFETTAFDMGTLDQNMWNTAHGRILQGTITPGINIRLVGHFEPILFPISLLYLIYSDPKTLLLLQTVLVALGALPAFWLARERLKNDLAAVVFPLAYLLYPPLEAANMFDFHPVTLAAPLFLFAFYFLQKRSYGRYALFTLLAMSCREDMSLIALMMGLYLFLLRNGKSKWCGLLTMAVGAAWFYLALFVIAPHFSPKGQHFQLDRLGYLGETPLQILKTMILKPQIAVQHLLVEEKMAYLYGLLAPLAFLSLVGLPTLLLSLPTLAMNLLSAYEPMYTLGLFQYAAPIVPFVIISGVEGLSFLTRFGVRFGLPRRGLLYLLSGLILATSLYWHRYQGFTPLAASFEMPRVTDHDRLGQELIALIPPGAAVSAQSRLVPHLSQRERCYMFPWVEDAEHLFFDLTTGSWPVHPNDLYAQYQELLADDFGVLAAEDGYILLKKDPSLPKELPDGFYDFARVEAPQVQYPMTIDFGDALRFLGFDLIREGETTSLRLYWRALHPLERNYRIYPFFFDGATGRIIEDTSLRPMTAAIWYPTGLWRPGQVVLLETLPWDVGDRFCVGLGVIDGWEWQDIDRRLSLRVLTSEIEVRPFDGHTAVELFCR